MSKLTEHASYLRGLAEGMNLDTAKNENKILLGMLDALEELSAHTAELSEELDRIADEAEAIDTTLADTEALLYGEEDGCCCEECGDEDCCECDEDGLVHFQCPNCGKPVAIRADAVEDEKSPVCEFCGEPFFTDVAEDEAEEAAEETAAPDQASEEGTKPAPQE